MNPTPAPPPRLTRAILTACAATVALALAAAPDEPVGRAVVSAQGTVVEGRLVGNAADGYRLQPAGNAADVPLESIERITWPARAGGAGDAPPPLFVLRLGASDRISGRLGAITDDAVRLEAGPGGRPVSARRAGARELAQTPGESLVLADGFEALDANRWNVEGPPPELVEESSRRALALPGGGSTLTLDGVEPLSAGRIEITYADPGLDAPGRHAAVELSFRGPSGPASVRVELGWTSPHLSVRTTGSAPALAVQALPRKAGWHRLAVDFAPDRLAASVDDQELAYGDGPSGVFTGLKLLTTSGPDARGDDAPRALFDDLILRRRAEPVGSPERDPSQDEVRLVSGDQMFGRLTGADPTEVRLDLLGRAVRLPWSEVAGVTFRRHSQPSRPLAGLWVRARWQTPGSRVADQVEGVLTACDPAILTLDTPYAGELAVPLGQLRELEILGRARRIVIDPTPHHLGSSIVPTLDPPQPDGRDLDVAFQTPEPAPRRLVLVLDVVQAIGVEGDPAFSPRVRRGELLTHLALDGQRFDQLNRHITTPNDEPLRLRITLPAASLTPGSHTLRFEQVGTRDDPARLDNLGLLSVGLEIDDAEPGPLPPTRPDPSP
jgi:hypothetical protein